MRDRYSKRIERSRELGGYYASKPGDAHGRFIVQRATDAMCILVGIGMGWEHVSVSLPHRCPSWGEMCEVKDEFWRSDECVVQYHPPKSQYVNQHPYCLHLWKPIDLVMPTPPVECV